MMEKTVVLHLKLEQWELAMGTAGNSAKSVQNDREEEQQGASEERIRLVVSGLPLGHEPSKTLAFSAEWIVNQEKLAVRKLSGAVQRRAASISWVASPSAGLPRVRSCRL